MVITQWNASSSPNPPNPLPLKVVISYPCFVYHHSTWTYYCVLSQPTPQNDSTFCFAYLYAACALGFCSDTVSENKSNFYGKLLGAEFWIAKTVGSKSMPEYYEIWELPHKIYHHARFGLKFPTYRSKRLKIIQVTHNAMCMCQTGPPVLNKHDTIIQ